MMDRKKMMMTKIKPINVNPTTSLRDVPHLGELDDEVVEGVIFFGFASTNRVQAAESAGSSLLEKDPCLKG
jgi:hypothetical protein